MQLSYNNKPEAGVAGQLANTMHHEILPASNLAVKAFDVAVATIQNNTAYAFTLNYPSRVPATVGQTLTQVVTITSDGNATKPEILEALRAAVAALAASIQISAALVDTTNGPLLVYGDVADLDFTITSVTANLTVSANSGEIPFGRVVVADGSIDKCRLPQLATDIGAKTLGVALRTLAQENPTSGENVYPLGSQVNVLQKGEVWVEVEEAVAAFDPVYVRYAANGNDTKKGIVRKSPDGVAQVVNYAPGEANATPYQVSIGAYSYQYLSDANGIDAEIIAAFIALINAQTALHGVTASDGTTTLTLTGTEGVAFDYSASANMVATLTTAAVATAALLPGAKFLTAASSGGLAVMKVDL